MGNPLIRGASPWVSHGFGVLVHGSPMGLASGMRVWPLAWVSHMSPMGHPRVDSTGAWVAN